MTKGKSTIRKIITVIGLLVIGTVLGPLFLAAIGALSPEENQFGTSKEAVKLVDAYRNNLEGSLLFLTMFSPDYEKECGYDTGQVFPDPAVRSATNYSDYVGFLALKHWSNDNMDNDYIAAITQDISRNVPEYEIAFLRRCIESTLFFEICMGRVSKFGQGVAREVADRKPFLVGAGHEEKIICSFVDGVAAQKGIGVVRRSN